MTFKRLSERFIGTMKEKKRTRRNQLLWWKRNKHLLLFN